MPRQQDFYITCLSCSGYGCPCDDAPVVCDGSGELVVDYDAYIESIKRLVSEHRASCDTCEDSPFPNHESRYARYVP